MKNAIFQYYLDFNGVGKQGHHYTNGGPPDWALKSVEYFKRYAEMWDGDYYFMGDRFVESTSDFFEVTRIFKDTMFDQYDKVLYCDVDVIPKEMTHSIFAELGDADVAGWPEHRQPDFIVDINWSATAALQQRFADFGSKLVPAESHNQGIRMVNSGVMVWSREARLKARELFDDHEKWFNHKNALLDQKWVSAGHSSHCLDQPYMNAMWNKFNFDVKELKRVWNRFPTQNENTPCYFAHYVGDHRFKICERFQ